MKKRSIIIILSAIFFGLIIIQFIPIDTSVPESDPELDFLVVTNPPRKIAAVIRTSCYDCHSYKTRYPWYSNFAPLSWIIKSHINEGLEHLNLSEFGKYSREESNHAISEMKKEISEKEMPLKSYLLIHREARLSKEMRDMLIQWLSVGKNDIKMP